MGRRTRQSLRAITFSQPPRAVTFLYSMYRSSSLPPTLGTFSAMPNSSWTCLRLAAKHSGLETTCKAQSGSVWGPSASLVLLLIPEEFERLLSSHLRVAVFCRRVHHRQTVRLKHRRIRWRMPLLLRLLLWLLRMLLKLLLLRRLLWLKALLVHLLQLEREVVLLRWVQGHPCLSCMVVCMLGKSQPAWDRPVLHMVLHGLQVCTQRREVMEGEQPTHMMATSGH